MQPTFGPEDWEQYGSLKFTTADWITWQSENKTHNSTGGIQYTFEEFKGIHLQYMVSTENNYDWLYININGAVLLKKAGSIGWTNFSYVPSTPIANCLVKIYYYKDGSVSSNSDRVWVRDIQLD